MFARKADWPIVTVAARLGNGAFTGLTQPKSPKVVFFFLTCCLKVGSLPRSQPRPSPVPHKYLSIWISQGFGKLKQFSLHNVCNSHRKLFLYITLFCREKHIGAPCYEMEPRAKVADRTTSTTHTLVKNKNCHSIYEMSQSLEWLFILNATGTDLQSVFEWLQLLNELKKSKDGNCQLTKQPLCAWRLLATEAINAFGLPGQKVTFFHRVRGSQKLSAALEALCSTAMRGYHKRC